MKKLSYALLWVCCVLFSNAALTNDWHKPLQNQQDITLQLKWTHQFQFAGYYMAKAKGFYQHAGLNVNIKPATPNTDPIQVVLSGQADYGIGTSELLLHHHRGMPVVVLGVIFQHSPLALLATEESGLDLITDLAGKKLMIEKNSSEIYALLKQSNIDTRHIDVIPHSLNIQDLLDREVDAMTVYTTTEVHEFLKRKIPYRIFTPRMAGIDFYGDNFFTTLQKLEQNPEQVEAFRKATIEGWKYAMNHTDEAIQYILQNYPETEEESLRFEADVMHSLMRTDLIEPGHMSEKRWQHISSVYQELGLINKAQPLNMFLYQPDKVVDRLESKLNDYVLVILSVALILLILIWYIQRYFIMKNQLNTIMNQSPLCIILIDEKYQVVRWNRQAALTFGWSYLDVKHSNILDFLVFETHRTKVQEALQKVWSDQKTHHIESKNLHRNGHEITCNWSNAPFHYDGKKYIICMALDTSELRALKAISMSKEDFSKTSNTKQLELFLSNLVSVMNLSLQIWEESTSRSKADFADESGLWRVSLDGGTAKTRTLDKYLSLETIPKKPRWKNVINTANYIIRTFPNHPQIDKLQSLKCSIHPPNTE